MKLVSIINAWADTIELLPKCIKNHLEFCDAVIVVYSSMSNHGNSDQGAMIDFINGYQNQKVKFVVCEISPQLHPQVSEARKRNLGIDKARDMGFTHFFAADADEFYVRAEVEEAKKMFAEPRLNGLVCRSRVYIGKPTLWVPDHTLVSFIHRLDPKYHMGGFNYYPFTYDDHGNAHIDPTRRINETRGISMCDVTMHHFSYFRANIDLKIQNSSANLRRSEEGIKRDIANAAPGYKVTFNYHQELQETSNQFNL